MASNRWLAHNVYFALKDKGPDARQQLVEACKKYLTGHPGEVSFAVGTLAKELKRSVNDSDFDVSLHIVFESMADHDAYQVAPRHQQFIQEFKANWEKVRVFDSNVDR
jgi:hypothetical protein